MFRKLCAYVRGLFKKPAVKGSIASNVPKSAKWILVRRVRVSIDCELHQGKIRYISLYKCIKNGEYRLVAEEENNDKTIKIIDFSALRGDRK